VDQALYDTIIYDIVEKRKGDYPIENNIEILPEFL